MHRKTAIISPKTEAESGISTIKTQNLIDVGKVTLKKKKNQ